MKNKVKKDNEYGNSRFNNENEIKKIFNDVNIYQNKKGKFLAFFCKWLKNFYFNILLARILYFLHISTINDVLINVSPDS